jgi:FkbM family methyltransferase
MVMVRSIQLLAWLGNRFGKPRGFERIVRWFASPEKCGDLPELRLVRDGLIFLARPGVQVDWHVLFFGTYEPGVRRVFRKVLPLGGVALDIGANVGWHTLLMASLVGASGRVLAVEANPFLRQRLYDHLSLNRFRQVDVMPYAVADTEGAMEFYAPALNDPNSGNGHVVETGPAFPGGTIPVEARRLDAIISASGVGRLDLIKIDVEGFEWQVFQGGAKTIARFRPHIIFEYDGKSGSRGGGTPELISEFFRAQRYQLFAIRRNRAQVIEDGSWPQSAEIWAVPAC